MEVCRALYAQVTMQFLEFASLQWNHEANCRLSWQTFYTSFVNIVT